MQNARVVPADDDDDDQASEMNNSFTGEDVAGTLRPLFCLLKFLHLQISLSVHVWCSPSVCSRVDVCFGVSLYTCVCSRSGVQKDQDNVCMFMILPSVHRCWVSGGYIMSL